MSLNKENKPNQIIFSKITWAYYYLQRIVIIYSVEFFTSALADGVSPEFEWQQVSSSLQDSSQYSSCSQ